MTAADRMPADTLDLDAHPSPRTPPGRRGAHDGEE